MAKNVIKRYSLTDIKKKVARGESETDWERLEEEPGIELPEAFWKNAKLVMPEPKKGIHIRLDPDVLAWFKKKGKGYQTRINAVLRAYVEAQRKT